MRFLILGAGAVGAVLGVRLEQQKHEVTYLVRPGRRAALGHLLLVDAASGEPHKRERPNVVELGAALPPFEWVLVCVRGDQLDAALETVRTHARPDARVVVAAGTLDDPARLRALHPGGPVVVLVPAFWSWPDTDGGATPNAWRWLRPPLVKTLVSGEGDAAADEAARELATALVAAGIPAQAVPSARRALLPLLGPGMALLAGWELCGWDVDRLARDGEVRALTADAMSELGRAVRHEVHGPRKLLTFAPSWALSCLLGALRRSAGAHAREMWATHGPKIASQTRVLLDQLIAGSAPHATERLRALRARLETASPLPPSPTGEGAPLAGSR